LTEGLPEVRLSYKKEGLTDVKETDRAPYLLSYSILHTCKSTTLLPFRNKTKVLPGKGNRGTVY
jgi:hypothetical protein